MKEKFKTSSSDEGIRANMVHIDDEDDIPNIKYLLNVKMMNKKKTENGTTLSSTLGKARNKTM